MKKPILYIIFLIAAATALTVSVSAYDSEAVDFIHDKMLSETEEIDLAAYSMSPDELSEVFDILISSYPELFFVDVSYTYNYTDDGVVISMEPKYKYKGNALKSARSEYEKLLDGIMSGVKSSWSDVEKLLYFHDYMAVTLEYDLDSDISDAYTLMKSGRGVCSAYTHLFSALCERAGIEHSTAVSESMNHIWNIVKVGGQWYHVDVTWDDTIPDIDGKAEHTNFLRSDIGIVSASTSPHENWVSEYSCTSDKYDSYIWKDVSAPFVFAGGAWYAFDKDDFALCRYDINSGTVSKVYEIKKKWPVWGEENRIYTNAHSGTAAYKSSVYFNSPDTVYKLDTSSGAVTEVLKPDTKNGYIYYLTTDGNALSYYILTEPNKPGRKYTLDLDSGKDLYSVTYTVDGVVFAVQYYSEGDKITPPDPPKRDGAVFAEWDGLSDTMGKKSITAVAVFEKAPCKHQNTDVRRVKSATCTEDGYSERYCTDCGDVIETIIFTARHTVGAWHVSEQATCKNEGLRERVCADCGEVLEREILPKTEVHRFGEWNIIKEASDNEDGERERKCELCGYVETEVIPMTGEATEPLETETSPIATEAPGAETEAPSTENTVSTDTDTSDITETTQNGGGSITSLSHSKLVIIYVIAVITVGIVNGLLIYLIVIIDRKNRRRR